MAPRKAVRDTPIVSASSRSDGRRSPLDSLPLPQNPFLGAIPWGNAEPGIVHDYRPSAGEHLHTM